MKTRKLTAKTHVYKWKSTLCSACLSQNRTLNILSSCRDIYEILCKSINLDNYVDTYLCWECESLLKKVHEFREKVRKSQDVLCKLSMCNEPCPLVSFSNLFISEILTLDTFEDVPEKETSDKNEETNKYNAADDITTLDMKEEDLEYVKLEQLEEEHDEETEEEKESFLENLLTFEENTVKDEEDYDSEIIETKFYGKTELKRKPKVRNYPNERSKRYIMTYQSLKWQEAVHKLKINNVQLKEWWEREKNSDHFQNLKNKCFTCLEKLKMDENLESHEQECHTETASQPYSCDICCVHFPSKTVLRAHIRKHYVIRLCNICGFECYSALHMRYHLRKAHTRNVTCSHCGESFKNTRDFYVHLKSHSSRSRSSYFCDQCGKRCGSLHLLEVHIKRSHETQRCQPCNMTFKSHRQLSNHVKLKHTHAPTELSFCAPCDKQFDNEFAYRRHLLSAAVHVRERGDMRKKEVACPVCLKVYSKNQTMMNHYRWVHTGDSRYRCEHCDKSFLNRTRYKDHMLFVHAGRERPRDKLCQFCSRAFTSNQSLHHHVLTHTGEKPHACPHCARRFRQKTALHSHIARLHSQRDKQEVYVLVPFDASKGEI